MRAYVLLLCSCLLPAIAMAQWTRQTSPVTSNLFSISTRSGTAWASGAEGVVLHSPDGTTWNSCGPLPGNAHAELRSIQAIDQSTAVAMSAGTGDASNLYRTTDTCKSWTKVFTNPEMSSSFDSLRLVTTRQMYLLGEPVGGKFTLYTSQDAGATWFIADDPGLEAEPGESAAGSTLFAQGPFLYFGTHGGSSPSVHFTVAKCDPAQPDAGCAVAWRKSKMPPALAKEINALGARMRTDQNGRSTTTLMAVGASATTGQAFVARSVDDGARWGVPASPPPGSLRAIAFNVSDQTWYASGTAGTFLFVDEGKTWQAGKGSTATTTWNAISLPFAVGDGGQIGKLETVQK